MPQTTHAALIELAGVSKVYGAGPLRVTALNAIDLRVEAGEFVSIMGPSGSGKSTVLNLISALDTPTSGRLIIDGQDTASMDDDALTLFRRRRIGLVFQFFNLLPTLDALDNVLLPMMLERRPTAHDRDRARQLLRDVGLADRTAHRMHELSGGQMQRVALARALMLQPRLLLADEPTGNLDSATGASILELLKRTCLETGTTIVMVTHDRNAAAISDRVVALRDGSIVSDEAVNVWRMAKVGT